MVVKTTKRITTEEETKQDTGQQGEQTTDNNAMDTTDIQPAQSDNTATSSQQLSTTTGEPLALKPPTSGTTRQPLPTEDERPAQRLRMTETPAPQGTKREDTTPATGGPTVKRRIMTISATTITPVDNVKTKKGQQVTVAANEES